MKKITQSISILTLATILFACGGAEKKTEDKTTDKTPVEENIEIVELNIDPATSVVNWEGTVLGVYSHNGTVAVTEGIITLEGNQVTAGKFTADLTTITPTDENYDIEKGKTKDKLVGHLSSPDFFMVDSFPTAHFEVVSHDLTANTIKGNLTIRGITNEATVEEVKVDTEARTASGKLIFDRTKYDVAFSHPAEDIVISNDVKLDIQLKM